MPMHDEKEARKIVQESKKKKYVRGPLSHLNYALWSVLYRPYAYDESLPILLPWFKYHNGNDDISRLNRAYIKQRQADGTWILRLGLWPFLTMLRMLRETRRHWAMVSREYGVSLGRQILDQIKLILFYNLGPISYYECHLFKLKAGYEQHCRETKIFQLLDHVRPISKRQSLDDKVAFIKTCLESGFPVPQTFAVGLAGQWISPFIPKTGFPPPVDTVLKPANLALGYGFELWEYRKEHDQWEREGDMLTREELLERCKSKKILYIMQERLINHSAIEMISPTALATARLVTYKQSDEKIHVFHGFFRMGLGKTITNTSQGELSSLIDLSTGSLLIARRAENAEFDHHPDTGARITGLRLPFWEEVCQLAIDAHKKYSIAFIGWDVVFTPDGPYFLEANSGWGIDERFPILKFFSAYFLEALEKEEAETKPLRDPMEQSLRKLAWLSTHLAKKE